MIQLPHNHNNKLLSKLDKIPENSDFETVSSMFKQLSDPVRLKIFWFLCHYEECVINISAIANMSSPAVAHHLRILKEGGLIDSRKVGKEVYYKASNTAHSEALHHIIELMMKISCPDEGDNSLHEFIHHHHDHDEDQCGFRKDQIELIKDVHKFITANLGTHYTITELSRIFLINTSTLKSAFKDVYGKPIAGYMKEYRMKYAMGLLTDTDENISSIAAQCGYENQSKFTAAFKGITGMLPKEYRNLKKTKTASSQR